MSNLSPYQKYYTSLSDLALSIGPLQINSYPDKTNIALLAMELHPVGSFSYKDGSSEVYCYIYKCMHTKKEVIVPYAAIEFLSKFVSEARLFDKLSALRKDDSMPLWEKLFTLAAISKEQNANKT